MTGMSHDVTVDLQPRWLAFQFPLQGRPCIRFTGKAPRAQMPALALPTGLCMVDLSLQRSLCSLLGGRGAHDDPAFAALRQGHDPTIPLDAAILGPLPVLTAFLQHRFRLSGRFRHPTHPLHPCCVQLPHIRLAVDTVIGHIHAWFCIRLLQLLLDGHELLRAS